MPENWEEVNFKQFLWGEGSFPAGFVVSRWHIHNLRLCLHCNVHLWFISSPHRQPSSAEQQCRLMLSMHKKRKKTVATYFSVSLAAELDRWVCPVSLGWFWRCGFSIGGHRLISCAHKWKMPFWHISDQQCWQPELQNHEVVHKLKMQN